jgi:hypothetical protein
MTNESNHQNNLFDLLFNYMLGRSAQAWDGETNGERSRRVFFYASHLGTVVVSIHEQTHTNTTHTPLTSHVHKSTLGLV